MVLIDIHNTGHIYHCQEGLACHSSMATETSIITTLWSYMESAEWLTFRSLIIEHLFLFPLFFPFLMQSTV